VCLKSHRGVCGEAFPGLDRVYGNPGNDTLYANFSGLDKLYGGYGDDTLTADGVVYWGPNHVLDGGPGADRCVYIGYGTYTCNP
jgi:Ca2+-binding RTX toxin-like protein